MMTQQHSSTSQHGLSTGSALCSGFSSGGGFSAVLFLDQKGKVLISRDYRGEVGGGSASGGGLASVAERFVLAVIEEEESAQKPVFVDAEGVSYVWIRVSNMYLLGVSGGRRNSNAMMMVSYLYRLYEVIKDYFGELSEEVVKENFVLIYELLDEMMDNGWPQVTETKILHEYIKTDGNLLDGIAGTARSIEHTKPPTAVTNAVSWRSEGIKHKKNEIFLDVVEKLNLLVGSNGQVLRGEILGVLKMKSFLSGMPELKLGLNDKLAASSSSSGAADHGGHGGGNKAVELEDIKFHQCVRLSRFEQDRTISFVPPDGDFELMSYRISGGAGMAMMRTLIGVEVVVDRSRKTKLEYMVKARSNFKSRSTANDVEIAIPVASDADTPQFNVSVGTARYEPERDVFVWTIKQFQGQKEFIMTATFGLPSVEAENREVFMKKPVGVKFDIPYFTVSGLTVRYLKIVEKSGYHALPWVRYITVNGDYQLRF